MPIILNCEDLLNKENNDDNKKTKLEEILTINDLKYFDITSFLAVGNFKGINENEYGKKNKIDDLFLYYDGINDAYNEMINYYVKQIDKIKVFYNSFKSFINYDVIKNECVDDYIKLKLTIEGDEKISYDKLISIIVPRYKEKDENKNAHISEKNFNLIYGFILEEIKKFNEQDEKDNGNRLKNFVTYCTGYDTFPIRINIYFEYNTGLEFHTCFNGIYFGFDLISNNFLKDYLDKKFEKKEKVFYMYKNKKEDEENFITKEFTQKQFDKYKNNIEYKKKGFYRIIRYLMNNKLDDEIKKEIKKNINLVFENIISENLTSLNTV